jgi:hypothetical protein
MDNDDLPDMPPIEVDHRNPDEEVAQRGVRLIAGGIAAAAVVMLGLIALYLWWSPAA